MPGESYDSFVDDSLRERSAAWSAAGAAIMAVAGGAAGVLWFVASRSQWQLALAVLSTVVAGLGLYWMLAALIPSWWFPLAKSTPTGPGTPTHTGRRPVIKPISDEEYQRLMGKNGNEV